MLKRITIVLTFLLVANLILTTSLYGSVEAELEFTGITDDFVFASGSENDIYAISSDGNVWHWNGAWWWQVTQGRRIEKRICVLDPDTIYGLSSNPKGVYNIYRWDGNNWDILTTNGAIKNEFHFVSEEEIYAIGIDNQVYLWNGTHWRGLTSGSLEVGDHIHAISPNLIYGIGTRGEILKWNGNGWQPLNDIRASDFFDFKSENEIYTIDLNERIAFWNGNRLNVITSDMTIGRRVYANSLTEIYSLSMDGEIWQWNGENWIKITNLITHESEAGSTYYRVKFIEGVLESQPAIIAYEDRLVIAGEGLDGVVYIREWTPSRNESWDSARNSQNLGRHNWYPLYGETDTSPELKIENGILYVYVKGMNGGIYRKEYLRSFQWSDPWEQAPNHEFSAGPFSSAGYTIKPKESDYPSPVSIYKFKNFNTDLHRADWIKNLIIYEISTSQFTSPSGPGTGTFLSAMEKLDYLQELGITAIWLSGSSWSDPHHFTNIYTQYASIHPILIEPTLGSDPDNIQNTELELKKLVETAHSKGIKVIVDVVSHGVMSYSPLVSSDSTFPSYVVPHPLQSEIIPHPDWFGAFTFPSDEEVSPDPLSFPRDTRMIDFVGGYEQSDLDDWWVDIWVNYVLTYNIDGFRIDLGSSRFDLWARIKEEVSLKGHDLVIIPEGEIDEYPFGLGIYDFEQSSHEWIIFANTYHNSTTVGYGATINDMKIACEELFPKLSRQFYTVLISCHDSLICNFKGSRFEMGYGAFFTPFIPVFMSGEEFNNPSSPIPDCTIEWLLASELQWSELDESENRLFLDDVKKAIELRQSEPALHYFSAEANNPNVAVIENYNSSLSNSPSPYLRFLPNGKESILICGNNNSEKEASLVIDVPLNQVGLSGYENFKIKNLWSNNETIVDKEELRHFSVSVEPDSFAILKLTPQEKVSTNIILFGLIIFILSLSITIFIIRRARNK